MTYDYKEAVKEDVLQYIKDEIDLAEFDTLEELEEKLNEELWTADSVTGNASGSYYCNTYKAEEALAHNLELIEEVAEEFGIEPTISSGYEHGAEWWDVSIRCYYLAGAISEALEEIEDEFEEAHTDAESEEE